MPFQKGNKLWDNQKTRSTWFPKGKSRSPETQFVKGLVHSEKWYATMHSRVQEKNPSWKGGLVFRKSNERKDLCSKYMEWVNQVRKRDNWKCRISNCDCSGPIETHHILNWVDYPELRYEVNNGITLCRAHHPRKWAEEKRLAPEFQKLVTVSNIII